METQLATCKNSTRVGQWCRPALQGAPFVRNGRRTEFQGAPGRAASAAAAPSGDGPVRRRRLGGTLRRRPVCPDALPAPARLPACSRGRRGVRQCTSHCSWLPPCFPAVPLHPHCARPPSHQPQPNFPSFSLSLLQLLHEMLGETHLFARQTFHMRAHGARVSGVANAMFLLPSSAGTVGPDSLLVSCLLSLPPNSLSENTGGVHPRSASSLSGRAPPAIQTPPAQPPFTSGCRRGLPCSGPPPPWVPP